MAEARTVEQGGLRLPVVLAFAIEGYQLFPGIDGNGIRRDFPRGVTIVAGVNGLGKTTFLNAMYRTLTGPVDSGIAVRVALGAQRPSLRRWSPSEYFGRRVEDRAEHATVELSVAFGDDRIDIHRSLADLALTGLTVNGQAMDTSEDRYQEVITQLAGLPRFEDFLVLLQYVVFVFEERPRVVWDPTAQSELYRFIVNAPAEAASYRDAFEAIASDDSARRNIRVQVNKLRGQVERARRTEAVDRQVRTRLRELESELAHVRAEASTLTESMATLDEQRRDERERLLQDAHAVEGLMAQYADAEQVQLRAMFPSAEATAQLVFVSAESGCLVCGDRSGAAAARVREQVRRQRCPFCDSEAPATEPGIGPLAGGPTVELEAVAQEAEERAATVRSRERRLETATRAHAEVSGGLAEALRRQRELERELGLLERQLPPDAQQVTAMAEELAVLEGRAATLARSQAQAEASLAALVDGTRSRIERLGDTIRMRFAEYSHAFLEESCELVYAPSERRIGQEGRIFAFPRFHVRMTSALSHEEGRPRLTEDHVSESQKEFIDLAFRMALIDALAEGSGATIVLETPEASLDRVFAYRAGRLFGLFGQRGGGAGNRLIATSNVTDGPMIRAMLGLGDLARDDEPDVHFVPADERQDHVVDLLSLAAETAAIRRYGDEYRQALARAMYPPGDAPALDD